jgi:hypothetical protein
MTLSNYQFKFNNLTIGTGTNYLVTNVEGLGGTSPLRIQDDNRGYIDGSYTGRDFYDERIVFIDITVLGSSTTTAQQNYLDLQLAFAPQPIAYYPDPTGLTPAEKQLKLFQYRLNANSGDRRMYGRSRGLLTPLTAEFAYGYIQTRVQLVFPDPRYYTDIFTTVVGEDVVITNYGWAISCPTITIDNPATSGVLTDGVTNMIFANIIGDQLIIDLLSRVIYLDGFPLRNIMSADSNGWLSADPNSVATWTSTLGSMSVSYGSAYV